MNRVAFFLISAAMLIAASEKEECFDIRKYVAPDFRYHMLELGPDLSVTGTKTHTKEKTSTPLGDPILESMTRPKVGIEARHRYYSWRRGTEWDINSDVSISELGIMNNEVTNERDPGVYKSSDGFFGNANGEFSATAAHYFYSPFFIGGEIAPFLSGEESVHHAINKWFRRMTSTGSDPLNDSGSYSYSDNKRRTTEYSVGFTANIRFGIGRIEDVTFAVAALNMFEKVAEKDSLLKRCNAADLGNLARLIEKSRRRRIFDSRLAFIENIGTIADFFIDNRLTEHLSPRTVLELADQWNYVFHQRRSRGYTIMMYPEIYHIREYIRESRYSSRCIVDLPEPPEMENNDRNNVTACELLNSEYRRKEISGELAYRMNVHARYEYPLSRDVQLSLDALGTAAAMRQWNVVYDPTETVFPDRYTMMQPRVGASEMVRLSWYPNTRTTFSLSQTAEYSRDFDYYDLFSKEDRRDSRYNRSRFDDRNLKVALNGSIEYYFSPRLLIECNVGSGFTNTYTNTRNLPWEKVEHVRSEVLRWNYSIGGNFNWKLF